MKIVINACHGGFSLSPEAVKLYAKLSGFKVWGYQTDYGQKKFDKFDKYIRWQRDENVCIYWIKQDLGSNPSEKKLNSAEWFNDRDIKRNDPILLKVIQKLKKKANGLCAKLKVVTIPDNVKWIIEQYDGYEWVSEEHRTWR